MPSSASPALVTQSTVPYKAFSGANIQAVIGNKIVGTLQALTCSITREVGAIYSFGDASPKAFVKGKRGIAGSLVFTQFDKHPLLEDIFASSFDQPLKNLQGLFTSRFLQLSNQQGLLNGDSFATTNFELTQGSSTPNLTFPQSTATDIQTDLQTLYGLVADQHLRYTDQLPEFDIVVSFIDDSGDAAFLVVGGVQLVNEGWGWSLDDLTSETAMTYVAKVVTPLTPLNKNTRSSTSLKFTSSSGTPVPPFGTTTFTP